MARICEQAVVESEFCIYFENKHNKNNHKTFFTKSEYFQNIFFPSHDLSSFPFCPFYSPFKFFLNNLFCSFIFLWFLISSLMVIISLELTRVNLDQNIFSIKCGTKSKIYFFTVQRVGPSSSPKF